MWELEYKENWVPKNWCFWTVVLEKTLECPLDYKEIQPVHPKGDQSWVFIGRTDVEAEIPILWPPHEKSWLIWKDPDAGKDLRAGGEGDDRGWDGWMASPTQWTCIWVNSGSWWWAGRPGVLRFMGLQRVRHDWATELNWMSAMMLENPGYEEIVGSSGPISGLLRKKPGGMIDLWDSLDMQDAPSAGFKGTQRNPYNRPWESMMEVFQGLRCQQGVLMLRTDFLVLSMNGVQATNTKPQQLGGGYSPWAEI